jgi:hypothetical protein
MLLWVLLLLCYILLSVLPNYIKHFFILETYNRRSYLPGSFYSYSSLPRLSPSSVPHLRRLGSAPRTLDNQERAPSRTVSKTAVVVYRTGAQGIGAYLRPVLPIGVIVFSPLILPRLSPSSVPHLRRLGSAPRTLDNQERAPSRTKNIIISITKLY